jgi:GNAT superfamily N-acetyltransferase
MRIVLVLLGFQFHLAKPLGHSFSLSVSSYELQVSRSAQRGGIGKALMKYLYEIARGWKMQKVVLTVFKGDDTWSFFGGFHVLRAAFRREPRGVLILQSYGVCATFR